MIFFVHVPEYIAQSSSGSIGGYEVLNFFCKKVANIIIIMDTIEFMLVKV